MDCLIIFLMLCALVAFTFILDAIMLSFILFIEAKGGCLSHIREEHKKGLGVFLKRSLLIFGTALVFLIVEIILYEIYKGL